eukprot:m.10740 g.10740  ORF g.10740 m.10740 type:complete len:71 (-) comp8457_c0_seq1:27-239(-)
MIPILLPLGNDSKYSTVSFLIHDKELKLDNLVLDIIAVYYFQGVLFLIILFQKGNKEVNNNLSTACTRYM